MELPLFLALIFCSTSVLCAPDYWNSKCDEACAAALVSQKPRPQSFCSKYLYPYGAPTSRLTITASQKTATDCSTIIKTVTTTSTDVFSVAKSTVTLPIITLTSYSSSVVIPSGPTPVINKCDSLLFPRAAQSCNDLSNCAPRTISDACSTVYPVPTSTITVTPKSPKGCKTTSTTTETSNFFTEITKGTQTVSPPPETVTGVGVLTTTVPAACAQPPYTPPQDIKGDFIDVLSYPYFPRTGVECCALCYRTKNCVAAAYSSDAEECEFLLIQDGSTGLSAPMSNMCPKGVQDLQFIRDDSFGEDTFVGPCGK